MNFLMACGYIVAAVGIGYLFGSIPFAYLLGKRVLKLDIREHGSGNIGATNLGRVGGAKLGALCLLLDVAKGIAPTLIFALWQPDKRAWEFHAILAGVAAVAGHMFPIWLKGSGGKGVATAAGAFLVLAPAPLVYAVMTFLVVGPLATRTVSAGSVSAALVLVFMCSWNSSQPVFIVSALIGGFVIWRHRGNLKRLWDGTESRIWAGRES